MPKTADRVVDLFFNGAESPSDLEARAEETVDALEDDDTDVDRDEIERPNVTDPKAKWEAFAIKHGADSEDAKKASKADLIRDYRDKE